MTEAKLESVFRSSRVTSRMDTSPLGIKLAGYACALRGRGYAIHTVQVYSQAAEHFCNWLAENGVQAAEIEERHVNTFLDDHLPECACQTPAPRTGRCVRPALKHLMSFLREQGAVGDDQACPISAVDRMILDFDRHLADTCGLSDATRVYRKRYVREFLEWRFKGKTVKPSKVSVEDIRSAELVRGAMRRAYTRADFEEKLTGTHMLRRTAATRMLGRGATMKQIADVLGHRSLDTTKVYTMVNLRPVHKDRFIRTVHKDRSVHKGS